MSKTFFVILCALVFLVAVTGVALASTLDSSAAADPATAAVTETTTTAASADTLSSTPSATVEAGALRAGLEDQAIAPLSVQIEGDHIEVVLQSKKGGSPEDTWARTVVQREVAFMASSGELSAKTFGVTIVDELKNVIYRQGGPVEAQERPAAKAVLTESAAALDTFQSSLAAKAAESEVTVKDLSIDPDSRQGLVVDATVAISAPGAGDARETQVRWATVGLLKELRAYYQDELKTDVSLYRLSIEDGAGNVLITYVVDPAARITRVWSAPGVMSSWR